MKKLFLFSILLVVTLSLGAQNTFPTSGNVGIGTNTPAGPLHIKSNTDNILSLQTTDNGQLYSNWIDQQGVTRATIGFTSNLNTLQFSVLNGINESMAFNANSFVFNGLIQGGNDVRTYGSYGPRLGRNKYNTSAYGIMGFPDGKFGDGNLYMMVRNKNTNNGSWISLGQRDSDADKGDIKIVAGYRPDLNMNGKIKFSVGGGETVDAIIDETGNIGIGTTSPDSKLTVKGKIHSEEVKVDLSVPGPDYVFAKGYKLPTLEELQAYIQKNKHLPNIPSAKEMEVNGVELGIMNMKLLEKIEELTLYTLDQEKKLKEQKEINKNLEKRLQKLEQLILKK